jgi:hypothetical protein
LIKAIPPRLRDKPLFNGYTFGGPLILAGMKPYIDGRAEMYGDKFVMNYVTIAAGDIDDFNQTAQKFGIVWTILPWGDKRLIDKLESSGRWRRLYSDHIGVIDVHR